MIRMRIVVRKMCNLKDTAWSCETLSLIKLQPTYPATLKAAVKSRGRIKTPISCWIVMVIFTFDQCSLYFVDERVKSWTTTEKFSRSLKSFVLAILWILRVTLRFSVWFSWLNPGGGVLTLKRVIGMSGGQDPPFHAPQPLHKTPFSAYFSSTRPPF